MRLLLMLVFALGLLLGTAGEGRAQEAARGILEKAVKAHRETEELTRSLAVWKKIKGALFFEGGIVNSGESFVQPEGVFKYELSLDIKNVQTSVTAVFNGTQGWIQINGELHEADAQELEEMKTIARLNRISTFVALLQDKSCTLSALGESDVEGQKTIGVQAKCKGELDVNFYFDKSSGLLLKLQYREKDQNTGKEVLKETVFTDYRTIDWALPEEQVLKSAKLGVDGPSLLAFIKQQTLTVVDQEKIRTLIRQLSDDSFQVREQASAGLTAQGRKAAPFLRRASQDPDLEVSRRARQCLDAVEGDATINRLVAAVRLVAQRKPEGATEVLLNYLPSTPDPLVSREARNALVAVAGKDGSSQKLLLEALEDKDPLRRAAATAALGRDGGAYLKEPGRRVYLSDTRYPMKITDYRDGKKYTEEEVLEVRFFNRFDDHVFEKPK